MDVSKALAELERALNDLGDTPSRVLSTLGPSPRLSLHQLLLEVAAEAEISACLHLDQGSSSVLLIFDGEELKVDLPAHIALALEPSPPSSSPARPLLSDKGFMPTTP